MAISQINDSIKKYNVFNHTEIYNRNQENVENETKKVCALC